MRLFLSFLLLCSCLQFANAQALKEFSRTKEAFYKELEDQFKVDNSLIIEDFLELQFKPLWFQLGSDDEKFVYDVANLMLKKRMKPVPHFQAFLGSIILFREGKGSGNYPAWKIAVKSLSEARNKAFLEDYLATIYGLLKNGELSQSAVITWSISPVEFTLTNDSVPAIKINDIALIGKTKEDVGKIYNVSGVYYPTLGNFLGSTGKITWERAGLAIDANYAIIENFKIKLSTNFFDANQATMRCEFYAKEMKGKLSERILTSPNAAGSIDYPVFDSYNKDILVNDIIENVDYFGGFSLRGQRFSGQGSALLPSKMVFKQSGKPFLEAYAVSFGFDENAISANSARVVVKLGKDSIAHSGVKLRYDKKKKKAELIRDDRMGVNGPFSSSYHNMDFYTEVLSWKNGDTVLYFGPLKGNASTKAIFESNNFFIKERYNALQLPGEASPIAAVANFGSNEFLITDFANYLNVPVSSAKQTLLDLANKGFLFYDIDQQYITVKDKLYDFLSAYQKKRDYDDILFSSVVPAEGVPNAVLNLSNYDLNVFGVKTISLSDSQSVALFADSRTPYITVQKNRALKFGGVVKAGGFDFYGKEFYFNYDSFKLDLIQVDSCAISIIRINPDGEKSFVPVRTKINNITGVLYIDKINNKSGLDTAKNKAYPILITNEPSYAYYDKQETFKGVYNKEKFYFKLDPFNMDSLDNFNQDVLSFRGNLKSAGIFPDIRDSLSIQDDYSLGFKHRAPKDGLPLYANIANFKNEIQLSDKGLIGDGDIEYLSSVSSAKRFNFFPDSTTALAQKIVNRKQMAGPDVPDFTCAEFLFKLDAVNNKLEAKTLKLDFEMFNKEAKQEGLLVLQAKGLGGNGVLRMFDGKLSSNSFRYNNSNAFADTATFDLNTFDNSGIALSTDQVSAQIDFNYRIGTFKALAPDAKVNFPKNQYMAYMDTYKWIIDEKQVELSSANGGGEGLSSSFYSLHPQQDSLNFKVPKAVYDLKTFTIKCTEVEQVLVADALVQPNSGQLNIEANAVIDTLINATIVADAENRFHTIFNATVNILAANKYTGNGNYNYEDDKGAKQKINFANIAVDSSRHTFAKGNIPESQNFKLNAFFDYRGDVVLKAQDKGLSFVGSTRIMTNCDRIERNWLAFAGQVDPKDVIIPVGEKMKNDLGEDLAAGIMLNTSDSAFIYPSFISKKINANDPQITTALGYLWYDAADKSYNIGAKERHDKTANVGNLVTLSTESCDITANGALSFGADYGQVQTRMVGNAKYNYKDASMQMNGLLTVDFYFNDKMMNQMAVKAASFPFLQPVNIGATQFDKAVLDFSGAKKAADFKSDLAKKGTLDRMPVELSKTICFADVKIKWDDITSSFVSLGDIGIASIMDKTVFTYVKGKMQFTRARSGSEIGMYLAYTPEAWYFFKYKKDDRPRMQFYSSDQEFMKIVPEIKLKDMKLDTKKGDASYEYEQGPRSGKDSFLERFE